MNPAIFTGLITTTLLCKPCNRHTPPCVSLLNVYSKTTESKSETSPFISVHLKSSYFFPPGENRLLKSHKGATSCRPQPGQSKRSILMIPDKIVRRYPPGCNDTLHYSRQIDSEDDRRGLCRGRELESLQCTALTCDDSTMSPFDLTGHVAVSLQHACVNCWNCLNNCIHPLSKAVLDMCVCVCTWCSRM